MTAASIGRHIGVASLTILAVIAGIGFGVSIYVLDGTPWVISTIICLIVLVASLLGIRGLRRLNKAAPDKGNKVTLYLVIAAIVLGVIAVPVVGYILLFHS